MNLCLCTIELSDKTQSQVNEKDKFMCSVKSLVLQELFNT